MQDLLTKEFIEKSSKTFSVFVFYRRQLYNSISFSISSIVGRLERELPSQKVGILDIRARLQDGTKINIEMQAINKRDILEKTLFYWSKLYVLGMDKGDEYIDMPKTITINILDYHFLPQDEFCLASHLYFDKHRSEYTRSI